MGRLQGRIALVTGARQGVGAAISALFVSEGATVYAGDLEQPGANGHVPNVIPLPLDVNRKEDWASAVGQILDRSARLDILVNHAGIVVDGDRMGEACYEDLEARIVASQAAPLLGIREVVPIMRNQGGGAIVNFTSVWGHLGTAGRAAYRAARIAVREMTQNAAITYAPDGIRVNSIHPGIIATPPVMAQSIAINAELVGATPMGRMGRPDEVARGVLFLSCDDSSFVTGAELAIDGGYAGPEPGVLTAPPP